MVILGIDPGTTRAGYGVVKKEGGNFSHVAHGILPVIKGDFSLQLVDLRRGLEKVLGKYVCDVCGVEKLFFEVNKKTAIAVAQARGVLVETVAERGITVYDVAPTEVKMSLTGNGHASKEAVGRMVGQFLKKDVSGLIDDEADALAVAIATAGLVRL